MKGKMLIKSMAPSWFTTTNRVSQGSVLTPVMFVVYINDVIVGINSNMNLLADGIRLLKLWTNIEECKLPQNYLNRVIKRSQK